MLASTFFNWSNNWFAYFSNFFFAAAGFGAVARFIYKLVTKHYDKKLDDVKENMNENFKEILSQYKPNGGSSSKDQWNKIEKLVEDLKHGQDVLHERVDDIKEDFAEHKGYHKGLTARED